MGHMRSAARILSHLGVGFDADRLVAQSPSILSGGLPADLSKFGIELGSNGGESAAHFLLLARLCFTFRNPAVAVALFDRASSAQRLGVLDRIAALHAQAEVAPDLLQQSMVDVADLINSVDGNPNALGMLVKVALVAGDSNAAREAMKLALQAHFGETTATDEVVKDCDAVLEVLLALRDVDSALPKTLLGQVEESDVGVPKVFLCGFGWSGSGALYDEVRGVSGFCEFEGAGCDAIINEDADSEVTFIQGPGGFGDLWRTATQHGSISWADLWNTFNLHMVGIYSIGYAQYKSGAAARRHVRRYGALYTGPFRRFLEEYARFRQRPSYGSLHRALQEATESLCKMVLSGTGGRAVLFNNAVFGRDALMLEVFRSHRAAIVYRDPRDVYVDRRSSDLNHWRTPRQLAAFYADGLDKYVTYKLGRGGAVSEMREVSFERFVKNKRFRARVRTWLLGDLGGDQTVRHFDPTASIKNIGIHVGALSPGEVVQLQPALDRSRVLDRLADESWSEA